MKINLFIFCFAEITSVTPSEGGTEGGTKITINGKHFDETVAKVKVEVGGE